MPRLLRSALMATACAALFAAPAQAEVKAGSKTVTSGDVTATLSWMSSPDIVAQGGHIKIDRAGTTMLDADLSTACKVCQYLGDPQHALRLRDIDGDGEPEALVDTYSGGAHCCSTTVVYYLSGATYAHRVESFGNGSYRLKDLNGDGVPEFLSVDDRFAYEFAAYAFSYRPPMILDFAGHAFVDRTRRFPAVMRADIAYIDRFLPRARREGDPRGLIAARMADLALLGRRAQIAPYLAKALRRGDLNGDKIWPAGKRFKPALLKFLKKTGYLK